MGIGLGRNSPVKLQLSKDNYVALIERHGQWVRWRIAQKCSCVSLPSMQPDIHCKICGGRGFTYTYQKNQYIFETVMAANNSGILEVSERIQNDDLVEVYDIDGNRYEFAKKMGKYVYLNSSLPIKKGVYYNVVVSQSVEKELEESIAIKESMGFYSIPGISSTKPDVDGVYYEAQPDIVSIGTIEDAAGITYKPKEFRLNKFLIEPKIEIKEDEETGEKIEEEIPITEPLVCKKIRYIPPFIFALLNQNLSKADIQMMVDYQGDAVLSYPYEFDVSNDDVLTVLTGTYTNKEVCPRTPYETDTLGVYFVYSIISCNGIKNNKLIEYKEGEDFILVGTNKIKWLDSENTPEEGEAYSITYRVLPTYKIVKDIPQLRTSENQRFPKKAIVKLMSTYSEKNGVNKQEIGRNPISGSY